MRKTKKQSKHKPKGKNKQAIKQRKKIIPKSQTKKNNEKMEKKSA